MIPFFIVIGIVLFIYLISILLCFSTLEFEVKKVYFDSLNKTNKILINIRLKFLNKFTWAKIKIDNKGIERYKNINNKLLKKITIDLKKELNSNSIGKIKKIDFVLKKINLRIYFSAADSFITSLACRIDIGLFVNYNCK